MSLKLKFKLISKAKGICFELFHERFAYYDVQPP